MQEPKNIFSYITSILNGKIKYSVNDKIYSQYVINYFISQHKDTVKFVELLNTNKMKLSNIEHYNICFNYCPKVGFLKTNKMPKKTKIDNEIFSHSKMSSSDIYRILNKEV